MARMAGELCLSNGNYVKALDHFREHLATTDDSVEYRLQNIACYMNIAGCLIASSQYKEGYQTLQEVVRDIEKLPNDCYDCTIAAEAYYNLGIVARKLGNSMTSDYFNQAVGLFVKAEKFENAGDLHSELAVHHSDDNDKHVTELQHAQEMYSTAGNKIKESIVVLKLISLHSSLGQMEQCQQMLTTAKMLTLTISDSPVQGQLLLQIGVVYSSQKMFQEALECFEKALSLVQSANESTDLRIEGAVLQNMGAVYNETKQFNEAIAYHKAAIIKNRKAKLHNDEVKSLCNLGYAQAQIADYINSANTYSIALTKAEQIQNALLIVQSLEGLGSVYYHMKQFSKSQDYFEKALEVMTECNNDVGLAKERIMEKLSDAIEQSNSTETRKLSESYLIDMTNYLSNCKSDDDNSDSSSHSTTVSVFSKDTSRIIHEGCLSLGPNAKVQYTTTTTVDNNTIVPINEPIQQPLSSGRYSNTTKTCIIL